MLWTASSPCYAKGMLASDAKQRAYAAMDDASSFRLVVADRWPPVAAGELAVEVCTEDDLEALTPAVGLVRKMARTFFGEKLTTVSPPPAGDGPFTLFVVAQLVELDEQAFEDIDPNATLNLEE